MRITANFDSGVLPPHEVAGDVVTFDLSPGQKILNALIESESPRIRVRLKLEGKGVPFVAGQGLLVSHDGITFDALPVRETDAGIWSADIDAVQGVVRVATRYPYGRDALDQLICETAGRGGAAWSLLRTGHRAVPIVEFGEDDGHRPIHYVIAGEDAWETAGCWTADAIVRFLCTDDPAAKRLRETSVVRIVPLVSPYSATREHGSYICLDGTGIYGAATWGDDQPPPEYAILRSRVEETIAERRLGLMLTIHSWQAQHPTTGLETIRTAGDNVLSEARAEWAKRTLARLIVDVPRGEVWLAEKIWHPGLARDRLLARHNAITFRVEITTHGQGPEGFRVTGEAFARNLAAIHDWSHVL